MHKTIHWCFNENEETERDRKIGKTTALPGHYELLSKLNNGNITRAHSIRVLYEYDGASAVGTRFIIYLFFSALQLLSCHRRGRCRRLYFVYVKLPVRTCIRVTNQWLPMDGIFFFLVFFCTFCSSLSMEAVAAVFGCHFVVDVNEYVWVGVCLV